MPRSSTPVTTLAHTRLGRPRFLTDEERLALQGIAPPRQTVRAAMDVVREGVATGDIHFLADGWAFRYKTMRDGRRQISGILLPGDILDIDAVLLDHLDFGVRMLTAGSVLAVPRDLVMDLADRFPGVARSVTWSGLVDNAMLTQAALCLGRLSARERVAHLLCEISFRLGFVEAGSARFELPMTQEHIADTLGLTPVHVNRTLQQLRASGMVVSEARTTTIPDLAALRTVAEFDPAYLHIAEIASTRARSS